MRVRETGKCKQPIKSLALRRKGKDRRDKSIARQILRIAELNLDSKK